MQSGYPIFRPNKKSKHLSESFKGTTVNNQNPHSLRDLLKYFGAASAALTLSDTTWNKTKKMPNVLFIHVNG